MNAAAALTNANRLVLRSAARFFLHWGDPERAHHLLRRSPVLKQDPWILAAEIATANVLERSSRFLRMGRRMIDDGRWGPQHWTELASALATQEYLTGHDRSAKRLFRQALTQATENTVAQVAWASRRISGLELRSNHLSVPLSYEARAWRSFVDGDCKLAVKEAKQWFQDEPFASRPAVFGSFVSSVALGDYEQGANFARLGLASNPDDALLRTNLVFALASANKVDEAERELTILASKKNLDQATQIVVLANKGLVAFRSGDAEAGRALYHSAVDLANEVQDKERRSWALVFLAREEIRARGANWQEVIERASKALPSLSPSSRAVAERMLNELRFVGKVTDRKVFDMDSVATNR